MAVSRRELLKSSSALALAGLLPSSLLAAVQSRTPALPDLSDWASVRAQFPLDYGFSHFASFFIASHPRPVSDALEGYRQAVDANPYGFVERSLFEAPEHNLELAVCTEIAAYLGGQAQEVCLTGNTTQGLALVYHGLPLQPGDEVLTTTHDHYSHHESIRLAVQRAGATMRKVALFEDASQPDTAQMIRRLRDAVGPRTRAVGLTWVHSSSGIRLPIREIAAALREGPHAPLLVVDGVHGLGATDETVADMGADFFCAGTHKWMFAPRGTGLVWGREDAWVQLRPTIPSFSEEEAYVAWMAGRPPATPTSAARVTPGGFHAFEHQWATAAAFRMHQRMGRARVAERIALLNGQIKSGLAANERVKVHTPQAAEFSAGLVTFEIASLPTAAVVGKLLERGIIASASPYADSKPRLAASLVNTEEEVEAAVRAVHEIAAGG